jgi:hypothetical protein
MRSIAATVPAIVWHSVVSTLPPAVDQPLQRISSHSCHQQREQRVPGHPVGHGSLTLANVLFGLRVAFACLADIAAALVVGVSGCPGGTIGHVLQSFPDMIQKVLGSILLRLAQMVIRR